MDWVRHRLQILAAELDFSKVVIFRDQSAIAELMGCLMVQSVPFGRCSLCPRWKSLQMDVIMWHLCTSRHAHVLNDKI